MRQKYQSLAYQEMDLMKELNQIDSLLPDDYRYNFQAYPQLFKDDDSLFKPDCIFENRQQDLPSTKQNILIRDENTFEKANDEVFEEYLDTLEINEFIRMHSNQESHNVHKLHKKQMNSLECTFKPSISKKSNDIAINLGPSFERLTNSGSNSNLAKKPYRPQGQQQKKQYSKERIERLSKPRVLKTQPNQQVCETKQKYKLQLNSKVSRAHLKDPQYMDVAARNALWEQQKKQKIQKLRKQEQQSRLKKEASSFTPKIISYKGEKEANISDFGKQGIANYFQRVNMASKNRTGKKNTTNNARQSASPYSSRPNLSKTPKKQNSMGYQNMRNSYNPKKNGRKNTNTRIKYQEAVEELHRKLMSLQI